jgi:hypothetical protein
MRNSFAILFWQQTIDKLNTDKIFMWESWIIIYIKWLNSNNEKLMLDNKKGKTLEKNISLVI